MRECLTRQRQMSSAALIFGVSYLFERKNERYFFLLHKDTVFLLAPNTRKCAPYRVFPSDCVAIPALARIYGIARSRRCV